MAFIKVEHGGIGRHPIAHSTEVSIVNQAMTRIFGDSRTRRFAGLVGTALLHIAAMILLVSRLSDPVALRSPISAPPLTVIDIGRASEDSSSEEEDAANRAVAAAPPAETTPPVLAEWSMQHILVRRATAPSVPVASPSAAPASGVTNGGRAGGGYDPYAGAAPEDMDRLAAGAKPILPFPINFDQSDANIADMLRNRLRQIDPNISFPLSARITIGSNGRILKAKLIGTTLPTTRLDVIAFQLRGSLVAPDAGGAEVERAEVRQMLISL